MTTAHEILQAAQQHMKDRASTYDKPEGERSMSATVEAFSAITGVSMSEEQGWMFMATLKAVRSQQGVYRADSYEDGAAYFALAGGAASADRMSDRERRETILDAINKCMVDEGGPWIKWDGKSKSGPLTNKKVEIKFRGDHGKAAHGSDFVSNLYWAHDNSGCDIIAYRIVK